MLLEPFGAFRSLPEAGRMPRRRDCKRGRKVTRFREAE
nr:MAG TPA: hypothetical protein [Caudoviricetes sp.]